MFAEYLCEYYRCAIPSSNLMNIITQTQAGDCFAAYSTMHARIIINNVVSASVHNFRLHMLRTINARLIANVRPRTGVSILPTPTPLWVLGHSNIAVYLHLSYGCLCVGSRKCMISSFVFLARYT